MCGRYSLTKKPAMLERTLGREFGPKFRPRYNIAPTQPAAVFINGEKSEWRELQWGLKPAWSKDNTSAGLINARSESIESKPSFRNAFQKRRCLVPADGFYEWRANGRIKEPVWIYLQTREPFAFAGIWEVWEDSRQRLETFSILTTSANELISPIHNRMPVILPENRWAEWLDSSSRAEKLRPFLTAYPSEEMRFHPVDTIVNTANFDNESCIQQKEPAQPMLFSF